MSDGGCSRCEEGCGGVPPIAADAANGADSGCVALIGNPNTGKTTLFNRLCGLRHKTSNFPGTTQEARLGRTRGESDSAIHLIDLPGIYSLALDQHEASICRDVLEGRTAPGGRSPAAVCVVVDATNLARNLVLVGEILAERLPTVIALNMVDLARRASLRIDVGALAAQVGCEVIPINARSGEGVEALVAAMGRARIPNRTPSGGRDGLETWADSVYGLCVGREGAGRVASAGGGAGDRAPHETIIADALSRRTDRLDAVFTHPIAGFAVFGVVMSLLLLVIFKLAAYPMDLIDGLFAALASWIEATLPEGILRELLSGGVVSGIGATVIFVPQIALLFFTISVLEDTGYLARAALMMDRVLRPFGLPGHSFVPLLSSHACALPGIMAARAIPDRRQRLLTILVAPFMTCSARLPVYVLVTSLLFHDRPLMAGVAFVGCYALGALAALVSALVLGRVFVKGHSRPMVLELPSYKMPSLRTALVTTWDRSVVFLKNAGTNILAISIVLWWLGSYPKAPPAREVVELREQAAAIAAAPNATAAESLQRDELERQADHLEIRHAKAQSFAGRLGRAVEPVFRPLGYDWQLSIGVMSSFAAREVFVSTMAVVVSGEMDDGADGVLEQVAQARRSDGSPVFTRATCWSLLVYYVLAMQCLPTLAVTAREAGGVRWAMLQLAWMSGIAYLSALAVYQALHASGVA